MTALVLALLAYGYYGLLWGVESVQRRLDTAGLGWVLLAVIDSSGCGAAAARQRCSRPRC